MRRNTTFSAGSDVPAATLNAMQDEQHGLVAGTGNASGSLALKGADGRYLCTPDAGVADGHVITLDDSIDWRARALWGSCARLESAAQRAHGASAWQRNDVARALALRSFSGSTGTGGLGAASASIVNGTPPVVASGAFALVVDELDTTAHRVWIYADPDDGALCLYNAVGATLHAELFVWASGVAPTPGDPPPDVIPTLTDVMWITPGLAADRPADPGGPAIYRSTDTGAVEIWDGGAWRSMGGGGSPTTTRGDLIRRGASADERLALGASGRVLTSNGTDPVWAALPWAVHTSTGTSTADATQTTCGSYTPSTGAYAAKILVHAVKDDYSAACAWELLVSVTNDGAGTVAIHGGGALIVGPTDTATTWAVTVDVSAGALRLRVTGAAATNLSWTARWIVG